MNTFENNSKIESGDFRFEWRTWVKDQEKISADIATKLDYLCDYINTSEEVDAREIKAEIENDLKERSIRKPVSVMLGMVREFLGQDERRAIQDALNNAGENPPPLGYGTHY